jgi:antitoxin (DNA-binding transcriptional repressor) of toxin-antitoxin stability system
MRMPADVALDVAERDLRGLLRGLRAGETVRLIDSDGEPVAVLVSLRPHHAKKVSLAEWEARWDALAKRVSESWQGDQTAVDTLSEMRR